jgi:hypothetical protein
MEANNQRDCSQPALPSAAEGQPTLAALYNAEVSAEMDKETQTERQKSAVALWIGHSHFLWEQLRTASFIEAGVLTGWYHLHTDSASSLSNLLLIVGSVLLLLHALTLYRHFQYLSAFQQAAGTAIPKAPPPLFGLRGSHLAIGTPLLLATLNIAFLFCDFDKVPNYPLQRTGAVVDPPAAQAHTPTVPTSPPSPSPGSSRASGAGP